MNNWMKAIRLVICIILLVTLCACGATSQSSEDVAQLNQQISQLEAQIVVLEEQLAEAQGGEGYEGDYEGEFEIGFPDIESLLDQVESSGEALASFPALITETDLSEAGCVLHIDRLEYNPNFTPGGEGGGPYLLNAKAVSEEIDGSFAYAQYNGHVEGEISQKFADYVAGSEGGVQCTLYMLGDELVLVSEILVP